MASRSAARNIQEQAILGQLGEASWRVRNGAVADLPDSVIGEVRQALSALCDSLAVSHLAAQRPEPKWPVCKSLRAVDYEGIAEHSLTHDPYRRVR